MNRSTTSVFAQMVSLLPRAAFQTIVNQYKTDARAKGTRTWDQLIAMLFCQASGASSLREIEIGLWSTFGKLSHCGAKPLARSTLSYANRERDYRVFEDYYFVLLEKFSERVKKVKNRNLSHRFSKPVYSLDSTLISLCLNVYDWAKYRTKKGGIKVNTMLNNDTLLPEILTLSEAKISDIREAKKLPLPKNSIIVMDRGYNDYNFFTALSENETTFVTRLKENADTSKTEIDRGKNAKTGEQWIVYDLRFVGQQVSEKCKNVTFRLVRWYEPEREEWFDYICNDLNLSAPDIAYLYRDRWEIEKFFRRLKQNLKVKTFVGTSKNAVLIQIWTAAIMVLLFETLRALSKCSWGFANLVWYLRSNFFSFRSLTDCLDNPRGGGVDDTCEATQMRLFD